MRSSTRLEAMLASWVLLRFRLAIPCWQTRRIVLSLATKCRTSLDTVFLEASHTYRKHAQSTPNIDRAINDERAAVYAEIQSLWDEMVPLAHMVVEKEYLKPILNKSEMGSERQSARDATIATYVCPYSGSQDPMLATDLTRRLLCFVLWTSAFVS